MPDASLRDDPDVVRADVDVVVEAGWVIPVEPDGLVLRDHAVVVADGLIHDVLSISQSRSRYRARETHRLSDHVLIPGLVNAHTHAAMTLLRGIADDLPLDEWLQGHIWPLEARWVSPEFVRDGVDLAAAEMIRGGVTCFADMYFHPDVTARRASAVGLRAVIGLIVIGLPSKWADSPRDYIAKGMDLHAELADEPLVSTVLAPHSPYAVPEEGLVAVRRLCEESGLKVTMHVHETAAEIADSLREHGLRPLARLARLGLVDQRLTAFHMTHLTDEEVAMVADAGVDVVHCPQSNLKLASGICPAARLLAEGVPVALGTDGAASNNDLDMIGEMRTAALLAKAVCGDASALPARTALRMATLHGAIALGLADRIGSIEPGKSADLTAVDMSDMAMLPLHNPMSNLVYAAGRHQVSHVWVAGRQLLRDGRLLTLDTDDLRARARRWRVKLSDPPEQPPDLPDSGQPV